MFEVQILIPQWDNNGKAFPQARFDRFEEKAVDWLGGYSRQMGISGAWKNDEGRFFHDSSRVYIVGCKGLADAHEAFVLAAYARGLFEQEAIYIRYLGLSETV